MVLAAAAVVVVVVVVVGNADENCIIFEPPAEPNKKTRAARNALSELG